MNITKSQNFESASEGSPASERDASSYRQFQLSSIRISYENRSEVREVPSTSQGREVVVKNFVCHRINNAIRKRTEIQLGSKLIILEDQYTFSDQPNSSQAQRGSSECDTTLSTASAKAKEQDLEQQSIGKSRRDKKNVVKNIIKAYDIWLKGGTKTDSSEALIEASQALTKLLNKIKFNNQLIMAILGSSVLVPTFQEFLRNHAQSWLASSKIKDRSAHEDTINIYLRACSSGRLQKPQSST